MEWLYLVNLVFAIVSGFWAMQAFNEGVPIAGWLNVFASAFNVAAFASHFF